MYDYVYTYIYIFHMGLSKMGMHGTPDYPGHVGVKLCVFPCEWNWTTFADVAVTSFSLTWDEPYFWMGVCFTRQGLQVAGLTLFKFSDGVSRGRASDQWGDVVDVIFSIRLICSVPCTATAFCDAKEKLVVATRWLLDTYSCWQLLRHS